MRSRDASEPSLDSFLDVVTNLVGILIILIMVISITAHEAITDAKAAPVETPSVEPQDSGSLEEAIALQSELAQIDRQREAVRQELRQKFADRNQMQFLLTAANTAIEKKRDELGAAQQEDFDLNRRLLAEKEKLNDVYDTLESLENFQPESIELKHYPTPMAKTVFGREEHFRLRNGRITFVPLNSLVDSLKADAERSAPQLRETNSLTRTVGPHDGFYCRYVLRRSAYTVDTKMGAARRDVVELDHFILVPVREEMGEPFEQALQPNSEFMERLAACDPQRTTITIWAYPDSFEEFRRLKLLLVERGFATAGRPLPADHPIGGSPDGSRSSAE
ncbi:MAG: hypothetical protein ACIALR_11900 [Blastopirellula sp. JB062]